MLLFALVLLAALTSCGADRKTGLELPNEENSGSNTESVQNGTGNGSPDISEASGSENTVPAAPDQPDKDGDAGNTGDNGDGNPESNASRELLQSASIDLDADGVNEQVEAVKIKLADSDNGAAGRLEGRLLISDGDTVKEIVFWKKDDDLSGIMTGLQFEDMDGDGANDVFIIIPGYGASFTYSNCFIYSYAKDKSCIFTNDNELAGFISSFSFKYKGSGNKLSIVNDLYGFTADLAIEESDFTDFTEEVMYEYADRSWIDPTSVDISESSRLALINSKSTAEIKVPLPVFGMATVNMIGEIDLYYSIDNDFGLVLERCEVIDFAGDKKIKAGSFDVRE